MDDDQQRVRDLYDSLTPAQQADVRAVVASELARGWIPRPREVEDVIEQVLLEAADADPLDDVVEPGA